jgi:hypothetical protein
MQIDQFGTLRFASKTSLGAQAFVPLGLHKGQPGRPSQEGDGRGQVGGCWVVTSITLWTWPATRKVAQEELRQLSAGDCMGFKGARARRALGGETASAHADVRR